jgi:translation initiation factor IF-3
MEGKMMSIIVSRAPGWEPPKKQTATPAATKKHHADQATAHNGATAPTPALVSESNETAAIPKEV